MDDCFVPEYYCVLLGVGLTPEDVWAERLVPGTVGAQTLDDDACRQRAHALQVLMSIKAAGIPVPSANTERQAPVTLDHVASAARSARVLIFVTHHDAERGVQLGTQMVAIPKLLEAIGADFNGVVDFGNCHTDAIAPIARSSCPDSRWILLGPEIRLDVRTSLVRCVLSSLMAQPRSYRDAFTDVLIEMNTETKKRKA